MAHNQSKFLLSQLNKIKVEPQVMKKRTRKEAAIYKEPSSDLSDLDLSSDEDDKKPMRVSAA